jgi:hypothetical protein
MLRYALLPAMLMFAGIASAQNVSINLLSQNAGLVSVGGSIFLEITINNTDNSLAVPSYKLRPQISVPSSIVTIPASGHQLPAGWSITSNSGSVIRLSNGTDNVPPSSARTILIALQGTALGGPSTISGNLFFSNGVAPGSASGPALPGDLTADNTSTTTVEVNSTTPVRLTDLSASLSDCRPALRWVTSSELNSSHFEIERSVAHTSEWVSLGTVAARGNSTVESRYTFDDNSLPLSAKQVFYRLRMLDRDGRYRYSSVLPVSLNCRVIGVNVFPNPVSEGRLQVSISGTDGDVQAVLRNLSGQLMTSRTLRAGTTSMDVSDLAAGVYVLDLRFRDGRSEKVRVVVAK